MKKEPADRGSAEADLQQLVQHRRRQSDGNDLGRYCRCRLPEE